MIRTAAKAFLAFTAVVSITVPLTAWAQYTLPDPVISIPGVTFTQPTVNTDCAAAEGADAIATACYDFPWIGQYLSGLYTYAVYVTAVLAAIVIMVGGFLWLTAAGNANQVSSARGYIGGALLGFALMLGSYTILKLINPKLVVFSSLNIPIIAHVDLAAASEAISGSSVPTLINCTSGEITGDPTHKGLDGAINKAATDYGLDPFFLLSIITAEDGTFDPAIQGPRDSDSFGLSQMIATTGAATFSRDARLRAQVPESCLHPGRSSSGISLYQESCKTHLIQHPEIQIQMAASYLQYIRNYLAKYNKDGSHYEDDLALVAGSYNQGEGTGADMIRRFTDSEAQVGARAYFQKVNGFYHQYCGSFSEFGGGGGFNGSGAGGTF